MHVSLGDLKGGRESRGVCGGSRTHTSVSMSKGERGARWWLGAINTSEPEHTQKASRCRRRSCPISMHGSVARAGADTNRKLKRRTRTPLIRKRKLSRQRRASRCGGVQSLIVVQRKKKARKEMGAHCSIESVYILYTYVHAAHDASPLSTGPSNRSTKHPSRIESNRPTRPELIDQPIDCRRSTEKCLPNKRA